METQELTCIVCPVGCRMTVTLDNGKVIEVQGNTCKRGDVYAHQECIAPERMVTAVAPVVGSPMPISLKTEFPIPKSKIGDCMTAIETTSFYPPILIGDVLIENVADTGVNIIATKSIV